MTESNERASSTPATRRIVSIVPSLTEAVGETPLRSQIVGITGFCTHPKGLHKEAQLIGGTKDPNLEQIAALKPSHILVNDEENKPEHIAWLAERFPVLTTSPTSLADVPQLLTAIGDFLAVRDEEGVPFSSWREELERKLALLTEPSAKAERRSRFVYFIWREPYMVAGPSSYISNSIELAGLSNHIPHSAERYPVVTEAALASYQDEQQPIELWLSSEPYPFRRRDIERLRPIVGPELTIRQVDGRLHSWYGYTSLALADALLRLKTPEASRKA